MINKPNGTFLLTDSEHEDCILELSFVLNSMYHNVEIKLCVIQPKYHKFHLKAFSYELVKDSKPLWILYSWGQWPFFTPEILKETNFFLNLLDLFNELWGETLKYPLFRKNPFILKKLARAVTCDSTTYNNVSRLEIPKTLKQFLEEHYYTKI